MKLRLFVLLLSAAFIGVGTGFAQKVPPGGYQNHPPSFVRKTADTAAVKTGSGTADAPNDELTNFLSEEKPQQQKPPQIETKTVPETKKSLTSKVKKPAPTATGKPSTKKVTAKHKSVTATPVNPAGDKASKASHQKHKAVKKTKKQTHRKVSTAQPGQPSGKKTGSTDQSQPKADK